MLISERILKIFKKKILLRQSLLNVPEKLQVLSVSGKRKKQIHLLIRLWTFVLLLR